jgi:hypothetical protein
MILGQLYFLIKHELLNILLGYLHNNRKVRVGKWEKGENRIASAAAFLKVDQKRVKTLLTTDL